MFNNNTYHYFKPAQQPTSVTVVCPDNYTDAERVLITSLQGLVAKSKPEVYIDYTNDKFEHKNCMEYFTYIVDKYCLKVEYENDLRKLLCKYRTHVDGYILTEFYSEYIEKYNREVLNVESLNVATSLAGIHHAVIVDESLVELMKSLDLPLIKDVRGKDTEWLTQQDEYEKLYKYHSFELGALDYTRDYCIACDGICFYNLDAAHYPARQKIFEDTERDTPVFGWGNALASEHGFTEPLTDSGHFWAAGHPGNLSFVTSFANEQEVKQHKITESVTASDDNHYVTFVISDGDSLNFAYNGFLFGENNLFDSDKKGEFPLGWGMPAALTELAPDVLQYIYNTAANGNSKDGAFSDEFISYSSGGYMYPSKYPDDLLDGHIIKLADSMRRSDTSILGIIDFDQFTEECLPLWDRYTKHDVIDGIFYVDFCSYATDSDTILWSNGKPIIASRARFWQGLPQSDIPYISKKINAMPTGLQNPNSYSLIMVHCWSRTVGGISDLIKHFDEHVKVVTPKTFVELVTQNVDRTVKTQKNTTNTDFLEFVIDTGDFCPEQTVIKTHGVTINSEELAYAPFANSPAGNAVARGYKMPKGSSVTIGFLNPTTVSKDCRVEFALCNKGNKGKITLKFFGENESVIEEVDIDFIGWKFFSIKNNALDDMLFKGYTITCDAGDLDFCLDEFVVRGSINRNIIGHSFPINREVVLQKKDETTIEFERRMYSFETFYASGTYFYTPTFATMDSQHIEVKYSCISDCIEISPDGTITAMKAGCANVEIISKCYGQSPLKDIVKVTVL